MYFLTLMFSLTSLYFIDVICKCPPDDPTKVIEYEVIPEDQYDRNFSIISDSGMRPLGFDKATWYYNQPGENPCVKISGAADRRIEIMFETHPSSRLCVKDQNSEAECSDAGTGSFYQCRPSTVETVYLEFFCDQGEEYDVRFWYRLELGELPANDPEDLWCDNRVQGDYPASLQRLPSNFPLGPTTTGSPDAGLTLHPCSLLLLVLTGFASLAHLGL